MPRALMETLMGTQWPLSRLPQVQERADSSWCQQSFLSRLYLTSKRSGLLFSFFHLGDKPSNKLHVSVSPCRRVSSFVSKCANGDTRMEPRLQPKIATVRYHGKTAHQTLCEHSDSVPLNEELQVHVRYKYKLKKSSICQGHWWEHWWENTASPLRTSTGAGIEGQIAVGASNLFLVVST